MFQSKIRLLTLGMVLFSLLLTGTAVLIVVYYLPSKDVSRLNDLSRENSALPTARPPTPVSTSHQVKQVVPNLELVTLSVGGRVSQLECPPLEVQHMIVVNGIRVESFREKMTGTRIVDNQLLWSIEFTNLTVPVWVGSFQNQGLFVTYEIDLDPRLRRSDKRNTIRRLDLETGIWLEDLIIDPGAGNRIEELLAVRSCDDALAVLMGLAQTNSEDPRGQSIINYRLTCFREQDTRMTPVWSTRVEGGGQVNTDEDSFPPTIYPSHPAANSQRLSWLSDKLIVSVAQDQPLLAFSRNTGNQAWSIDRIWEYRREYIGPSVYGYYLSRFGLEKVEDNLSRVIEDKRSRFDQMFTCSLLGGPMVVPLNIQRSSDSHSIFVAVSKSESSKWSSQVAECVIYELNQDGRVLSMATVPQSIETGTYQIVDGDVICAGGNRSFVRLAPSQRLPQYGTGLVSPDLKTKVVWFRQIEMEETDEEAGFFREAASIVFNRTSAFFCQAEGRVEASGGYVHRFAIDQLDLKTGMQRRLILTIPFKDLKSDSVLRPDAASSSEKYFATTFDRLCIVGLHADDKSLSVTLGSGGWRKTLRFRLADLTEVPSRIP